MHPLRGFALRRSFALVLLPMLMLGPWPGTRADTDVTEEVFLGEVPKVLSATRLYQSLSETPAAVTIIDRQMIEASGANKIADLLRLVPGFQVGHDGGIWSTVTYHGLSDKYARRMQVLIDGRSVYTPAFGGVVWNDLPIMIEDIERIEVIRGPNGVTYGANSFTGVINIITRAPEPQAGAFLKYEAGKLAPPSNDIDAKRAIGQFDLGDDKFRYRMSIGHDEDDGIPDDRIVNDHRTTYFNFRGDYRASAADSLDILFGYAGGPRGEGETRDLPEDPPRDRQMDSNYQQLVWRRALNADDELRINVYHTYLRSYNTYGAIEEVPVSPPINSVNVPVTKVEDAKAERYDIELQHTLRLAPELRLVWGAEARRDEITAPGYLGLPNAVSSDLWRLFGNAEWRIAPAWIVNAGAMYERSDMVDEGDISPRLAVNHHLTPNQTVRAIYSRAYRTPSVFENAANASLCGPVLGTTQCALFATGNPNLNPERIDSVELGYFGTLFDRTLTVDLKVYRERIRDVIAWASTQSRMLVFYNDGSADIDGWETQLEWRPWHTTRLLYSYAYAHQRGRILTRPSPPTYGKSYDSTPVHTSSLMWIQKLPFGFEADINYYRTSNMRWLDQDNDDNTGGFNTVDARLAYKLRLGQTRGVISLIGQNLTGDYFDYRSVWTFDKRYYANLSLEIR